MINVYPIWWDQNITVYNKHEDTTTQIITWYRTNLSKCFWQNNIQKMTLGQETLETNSIICRIPKNDKFIEKYEWLKLPNDQKSNFFTLGEGDIIIKGNVSDVIDEYTKGSRSNDLKEKYKYLGCLEINNISINTGTGVGMEHYLVRGL